MTALSVEKIANRPGLQPGLRRRTVGPMSLVLAFMGPAAWAQTQVTADPDAVTLEQARDSLAAGRAVVIDIREPAEFSTGVIAGAKLLPMSQLAQRLSEIPTDPSKPVLLICNTQNRSSATLKALRQRGYEHVRYVNGGMSAWNRKGLPTVKP